MRAEVVRQRLLLAAAELLRIGNEARSERSREELPHSKASASEGDRYTPPPERPMAGNAKAATQGSRKAFIRCYGQRKEGFDRRE